MNTKPLVIDLFCGLGGWSEAFLEAGYRAVGFDIEAHDYGNGCYPGELVLRDVRSLTGNEIVQTWGVPAVIVASPPCQEFSYMAMPWSKAKAKQAKILADPAEQVRLCDLFNQCFRIQREVSAAAGRYVPLIVENVRGAQRWVGRSRWNFGSFHLWGDVPALMPIEAKFKTHGMNWSDQTLRGQDFTRIAGQQAEGLKWGECNGKRFDERPKGNVAAHREGTTVQSKCERCDGRGYGLMNFSDNSFSPCHYCGGTGVSGRRTDKGNGVRFTTRDCGVEGIKQGGTLWHDPDSASRTSSSKSPKRKQASAEIAKIPRPLAAWIARCFLPK